MRGNGRYDPGEGHKRQNVVHLGNHEMKAKQGYVMYKNERKANEKTIYQNGKRIHNEMKTSDMPEWRPRNNNGDTQHP